MGGQQLHPAGQAGQPVQRDVLQLGECAGPRHAQQVGTAGGGHQQAAAGEHRDRLAVDEDQVAGVLGRVAGGVDRADAQPSLAGDVLHVERRDIGVGRGGGCGQHQLRAGGQRGLLAAGDIVVVQVGLQHEPQFHVELGGLGQEAVDVTLGVDQDAVALVGEQVALIPQAGGTKRDDLHQ